MHISHAYTGHTYIMGYCIYLYIIYMYLHEGYMYKFTYVYMRSMHWTPFSALMSSLHYISIPAYHRWCFQITLQKACMEHDRISVVWLKILVSWRSGAPVPEAWLIQLVLRAPFPQRSPLHPWVVVFGQASWLVMLLALLLLQQLLIGLAGVNHESFVKADGFSAWLFPICIFSSFLRTTFVSSKEAL